MDLEENGRQLGGSGTNINLVAAASGSGHGGGCPEGIPVELGLLSILAAFGVAFGVLYMALTLTTAGRRKRSSEGFEQAGDDDLCETDSVQELIGCGLGKLARQAEGSLSYKFADLVWHGLEEFEEKIDKIAEGEDDGESSWISKIYNQFSFFNDDDVENSLDENNMDGLEPPLLDETWGLGVRKHLKDIVANATLTDAIPLEEEEAGTARGKRSTDNLGDDHVVGGEDEVEEKCRVAMWRCLSHVVEGGLQYMDQPEGLLGFAKKSLFKIAFHGGLTNVWGGVMKIPEARQVKLCMTEHTECMSYEVLRREAHDTLDPRDPMLDEMYRKKQHKEQQLKQEEKKNVEKPKKRERLIVNPDFVENLDTDDGSVQYNEV